MEQIKRMEALREKAKLLRESLEKSNVTTDKIVAALGSFDNRLSFCDSAVKPIQGEMHETMRIHANINKCLKRAEFVAQQFDRIREIKRVLNKGPSDDDLNGFLEGMDELMRIIHYFRKHWRNSESALSDANGLLSKAINMAENEFNKLIRKNSEPINPHQLFQCLPKQVKSVPEDQNEVEINEEKIEFNLPTLKDPNIIPSLNRIALRLGLVGRHMRCLQIYREARANALETSLSNLGLQRLGKDEVQKMQWESLEQKIPSWIDIMRISIKLLFAGERQLCDQVFRGIEDEFRDECFAKVTSESLATLLSFPDAVVKVKRSPEKLFMLLDLYDMMCELQPEMEGLFTGEPCIKMLQSVSSLHKRLAETAAETFEGFAVDVEKDPPGKPPTTNGAVHPLSSYVMNFLKFVFDYKALLEKLLGEYSEGKEDAENLQFLPAILRILQALQNNLEAKSKHCKEHGLGYIFLMNNIHYMVNSVIKTDEVKEILGDDWIQRKRRIVQQNANLYRRACWGKVTESLSSQGLLSSSGGGGSNSPKGSLSSNALKHFVKERLKSFNAQLEEIHEKHCLWKVHDEDLKDNLRLIVAEILLPAYRSFLKIFGPIVVNSKTKYVKYTPEDIERFVGELFEGKTPV
ncbi:hypothetical protein LUZ60_016025 [Juncus effusus]|nr:hypothetical protein LUZ60_016025 [Juncus effusus]